MSAILTTLLFTGLSSTSQVLVEDVTEQWQLAFSHVSGFDGRYLFPEITGSGLAVLDANNDGLLDVYLIQAGALAHDQSHSDRLFINTGRHLKDSTAQFRLHESGYGMGAAVADVNADGYEDIVITNYGRNRLLINNKGESFDAAESFDGGDKDEWSTSAAFFDFDRDGDLDLYVANYVRFDIESNPACYSASSRRDYCGPSNFVGQADRFYENTDGTLIDRTTTLFPEMKGAAGLGVVARDFDGDGWIDVYVANDGEANFLWLNQEGESFADDALFAGVAMNSAGLPEASMGIVADDLDGDGDVDLFLSHLKEETNTLYRNDGRGEFTDTTAQAGLAAPSNGYTGWGTLAADLNADNLLDLIVVNGAVRTLEEQRETGNPYPFAEMNQIFLQGGNGFGLVTPDTGSAFYKPYSSRGAAKADLDNDGVPEILISNGNAPTQLFTAEVSPSSWFGLSLKPETAAIGARVRVEMGDTKIWRTFVRDGSYASSSDPRLIVYPPAGIETISVEIQWPSGESSSHSLTKANTYHTITKTTD